MTYVDGFVIVMPKKNLAKYKKMAQLGKKMWLKHGALDYKECIADDLKPHGSADITTFPQLVKLKPSETVVFSFIVYKSRAHRDKVNAKVMKDPAMGEPGATEMPFTMKRMSYGGFTTIVE